MFVEKKSSPTISSGTLTLDLNTSTVFEVTLNANITTLTISNPKPANDVTNFILIFVADGTQRSVQWSASIKWACGTPTISSTNGKRDVFSLFSVDGGTTWLGVCVGKNM